MHVFDKSNTLQSAVFNDQELYLDVLERRYWLDGPSTWKAGWNYPESGRFLPEDYTQKSQRHGAQNYHAFDRQWRKWIKIER